jgi:transcriptional regulator with XRE-family HTH domain
MGTVDDTSEKLRFGRDLAIARERMGKNRSDLAADMELSSNAIKKWEDGLSFPVPSKWNDIKNILGIDPQSYKLRNKEPQPQLQPKPKTTPDQELEIYKNEVINLLKNNELYEKLLLAREEQIVDLKGKLASLQAAIAATPPPAKKNSTM